MIDKRIVISSRQSADNMNAFDNVTEKKQVYTRHFSGKQLSDILPVKGHWAVTLKSKDVCIPFVVVDTG